MKISVVIPFYNETEHIHKVVKDVNSFVTPIIVDDGSNDFKNNLSLKSPAILLTHKVNLGKGAAMKTGAEYAFGHGSDAVIFMDADGQHSAKNIALFETKLNTGKYDVILGSRNINQEIPFVRYIGNKVASLVIKILFGVYFSDPICGYRGVTKKAFRKLSWESTGYGVEVEILAKMVKTKLKFTEIPVDTIYHDKDKGVTILDAITIFVDVLKWRLTP